MSFTAADVIASVRIDVNDTKTPYRQSDANILNMVNRTVKRISILRPDLFAVIVPFTCTAGVTQTLPANSMRLIDVLWSTTGQMNVNEVDRDAMDLMFGSWEFAVSDNATDWMRDTRNPNVFYVYPPSDGVQALQIEYAKSPNTYALGDTVELPDAYFPIVVDGAVAVYEGVDDESIGTGRAKERQTQFMEALGLSIKSKDITDTRPGGEDMPQQAAPPQQQGGQ